MSTPAKSKPGLAGLAVSQTQDRTKSVAETLREIVRSMVQKSKKKFPRE